MSEFIPNMSSKELIDECECSVRKGYFDKKLFPELLKRLEQPNKKFVELYNKYDWLLNTCDHLGGAKTSIGSLNMFEEFKVFRKGILDLLKEMEKEM
jgi:hypothetical protein